MANQSSAKQTVVDIVQDMPEDSSYDEILQELIMNRMIERGLADVEAGRTITDEEAASVLNRCSIAAYTRRFPQNAARRPDIGPDRRQPCTRPHSCRS